MTAPTVERARAFLEAHRDTSVFLLSCLEQFGPEMGTSPLSGNYRLVEERGEVAAVFALTRRGDLLAQTGGRGDLAPHILRACDDEPIRIAGVVAEWPIAEAVWRLLVAHPDFRQRYAQKQVVYRLAIGDVVPANPPDVHVRALTRDDFDQWDVLNSAFLVEEDIQVPSDREHRRAEFVARASTGRWWGAFSRDELVTTAGLNASYRDIGQIAGVFSRSDRRRKGFSRATMNVVIAEARERHGLSTLVLFAAETNVGARLFYESLGFTMSGYFGLLFGGWETGGL